MPERDSLIHKALQAPFNYSQRQVAAAAHLTQQRVKQIKDEEEAKSAPDPE